MMTMSCMVAASALGPTLVAPKVVGASLFKNGYAMVVRQIPVPGAGEYRIEEVPTGALGTVWFSAEGVKLDEVATIPGEGEGRPATTMGDLLLANAGRRVQLVLKIGIPVARPNANSPWIQSDNSIEGTLIGADGDMAVMETDDGTVAVAKSDIIAIHGHGGRLETRIGRGRPGLRLRVNGGGAGRIYMVALERGLTWAPSYQVEILDEKRLRFTGKATIMNDLVPLKDAELRLVAGFPNVPYAGLPDPLTASSTVSQFVTLVQGIGRNTPRQNDSGPTGQGFGGGRAGEMLAHAGQRPSSLAPATVGDSLTGEQVEDLFFFTRPATNLDKGERSYATLFQAEVPYERRHLWNMDPQQPDYSQDWYYRRVEKREIEVDRDVWDIVEFKNLSSQPLSTGIGVLTRESRLLGQSMFPYTPRGGVAEARVNKAIDVGTEFAIEDIANEPPANGRRGHFTRRATATIRNGKSVPLKMRIEKRIAGELLTSELPVEKRTENERRGSYWHGWYTYGNPVQELVWRQEVKPGETKTFSFTYRVYHW